MGYCPCFGFGKKRSSEEDAKKDSPHVKVSAATETTDTNTAPNEVPVLPATSNKSRNFTYQELETAINNVSENSFLGRGGFGAVFKGKLETGQVVAVKQLDPSGVQGNKEFLVELLMLTLLDHPNLVKLIGYCSEGSQRCVVYEYMPLGSLEDHLFDLTPAKKPLDWDTRMKIAAGVARGLDNLHSANPPVIYRDMKPSNILLDEGFLPKLSDFGLAKFGPTGDKSHVTTRVMGTYGYCAPEYAATGKLTVRTDIYSFGIVLLELVTGRRAIEKVNGHSKHITTWAIPVIKEGKNILNLADPSLQGKFSKSGLMRAVHMAALCLLEDAKSRPKSGDLVMGLDYLESKKYNNKDSSSSSSSKDKPELPAKWPEIRFSPLRETAPALVSNVDRDRAVAEAKVWGETWREKKQQQQHERPRDTVSESGNR